LTSFVVIKYTRKINGEPIMIPKENIVRAYIEAKKNKICPLITFVD